MPKYSREMENKIIAAFEQGKRNSVISRELSIYRGALPSRRKEWEKRKQGQEKPETEKDLTQKPDHQKQETEPEKIIQQEQNDSHPLDTQIYTLIRYQGSHSREEAISQAIETQHSFNPYILNHGLKTPKELMKFFEDKIQHELTNVKDLKSDLDVDIRISRGLVFDQQETIAKLEETITELKELAEERYEEGKKDYALIVSCTSCGQPITLTPETETHQRIVEFCRELRIIHTDCAPRYRRIYV